MSEALFEVLKKLSIETLAKIFAPESLILSDKQEVSEEERSAAEALANELEPGDIILTQTPGRTYEILRAMSISYFDHVAVFIDKYKSLQVGPPRARFVPSHLFLRMSMKPYVIRLNTKDRDLFLENIHNLYGQIYNYTKALCLWSSICLYERSGLPVRVDGIGNEKLICTDSILGSIPEICEIRRKHWEELDFSRFGSHSINDFLVLIDKKVFSEVCLPFPFNVTNRTHKSFYSYSRSVMKEASLVQTVIATKDLVRIYTLMKTLNSRRKKRAHLAAWALVRLLVQLNLPGFQILKSIIPRL